MVKFLELPASHQKKTLGDNVEVEEEGDPNDNGEGSKSFRWTDSGSALKRKQSSLYLHPPVSLSWSNIDLKVHDKKTSEEKFILKDVSGSLKPYEMTAIMGLSGSGKSTLLNAIAGRLSQPHFATDLKSYDIRINDNRINTYESKSRFAYVEQHDTLLSTATAREAITFSARLRLGKRKSPEEVEDIIDAIVAGLKIEEFGDIMISKLSGGQKRRVSLGIELVSSPQFIFADEVTSGLDSANASQIVEGLRFLADEGTPVVVTIHQPDSHVFSLFDNLILMHKGRCIYSGPIEEIQTFFGDRDFNMPNGYNTADWVIAVAKTLKTEEDMENKGFLDEDMLLDVEKNEMKDDATGVEQARPKDMSSSMTTSVVELTKRQMRNFLRNSKFMIIRFSMAVMGGALIGLFLNGVGRKDSYDDLVAFQSHIGACFMTITCVSVTVQVIMLDIVDQRPLFEYEYSRGFYGILAFSLSQIAFEALSLFVQLIVFFGIIYLGVGFQGSFWVLFPCIFLYALTMSSIGFAIAYAVRDATGAKELIPITVLPQLLLCGFFVAVDDIPAWLQWATWVFPLTYTFRLFINEEFSQCAKEPDTPEPTAELFDCLNVLQESGFNLDAAYGPWYTDNTVLSLVQFGEFKGRKSILEYLSLDGNLFIDNCAIQGTSTVVDFVPEQGYCDVTVGQVVKIAHNPSLSYYEGFVEYIFALHFQFPMPTDPTALEIDEIAAYYANDFMKEAYSDQFDKTKSAGHVCTIMQNNCTDVFQTNGFNTFEDCTEDLSLLPKRVETPDGIMYDDGNSTGCRVLHSFLARENDVHCAHISYAPIEDVNGKTKCSESAYFKERDFFSEASLEGFERMKEKYGFDDNKSYSLVDRSEAGQCATESDIQDDLSASMVPAVCEAYIRTQKATDSYRDQYWGTFIGMFFAMRIIGMILMKMRAKTL